MSLSVCAYSLYHGLASRSRMLHFFRTIVLGWRRRSAMADTLRTVAETLRLTVERDREILGGPAATHERRGKADGVAGSNQ